eukprot:1191550-Prorocentrum_minimum.AAC.5
MVSCSDHPISFAQAIFDKKKAEAEAAVVEWKRTAEYIEAEEDKTLEQDLASGKLVPPTKVIQRGSRGGHEGGHEGAVLTVDGARWRWITGIRSHVFAIIGDTNNNITSFYGPPVPITARMRSTPIATLPLFSPPCPAPHFLPLLSPLALVASHASLSAWLSNTA